MGVGSNVRQAGGTYIASMSALVRGIVVRVREKLVCAMLSLVTWWRVPWETRTRPKRAGARDGEILWLVILKGSLGLLTDQGFLGTETGGQVGVRDGSAVVVHGDAVKGFPLREQADGGHVGDMVHHAEHEIDRSAYGVDYTGFGRKGQLGGEVSWMGSGDGSSHGGRQHSQPE